MKNPRYDYKFFKPQGFTQLANEFIRDPRFKPYEKLVVAYIYSWGKSCYASQAKIANDLRLNRKTVQRTLKALKAKRVVKWTHQKPVNGSKHTYNHYEFYPEDEWMLKGRGTESPPPEGL